MLSDNVMANVKKGVGRRRSTLTMPVDFRPRLSHGFRGSLCHENQVTAIEVCFLVAQASAQPHAVNASVFDENQYASSDRSRMS
jgi:hypothetical protein